jgi:1,6-anhydro-N-acetylmuramate kinase
VDADFREAAAFALLGHEFLHCRPGSFPNTTGCKKASAIGALWA